MSGDIRAINSWARSVGQRARALAMNMGINGEAARTIIIKRDAGKSAQTLDALARHNKSRTGK